MLALAPGQAWAQAAIVPVPGTTTRDIPFTSHDGYPMLGRLTLPDTPGPHPVLMLVQTAEAATMDGELRNSKGVRVRDRGLCCGKGRGQDEHGVPLLRRLDHGLGTITYFNTGAPSTGYAAIFEFMKRFKRP